MERPIENTQSDINEVELKLLHRNHHTEDVEVTISEKPSPYEKANWISKVTLWWMNSLFRRGWSGKLYQDDRASCLPQDRSEVLYDQLDSVMKEKISHTNQLARSLVHIHKFNMFWAGFCQLIMEATKIFQPFLISVLVSYLEDGTEASRTQAILCACVMITCGIIYTVPYTIFKYITCSVAMKARSSVTALIYSKTLRLNNHALATTSSGDILNLLATDVEHFQMGIMFCCYLWISPIVSLCLFSLLFYEFRLAFLVGFIVLILLVLMEVAVGLKVGKMRLTVAGLADKRQSVMHDIITGIRMIKTYCWETPYVEKVQGFRKTILKRYFEVILCFRKEVKAVRCMGFSGAPLELVLTSGSKVATFATLIAAVLLGHTWTLSKVFKLLTWMEMCRLSLFSDLLAGIYYSSEMYWSVQRIQKFLDKGEINTSKVAKPACTVSKDLPDNSAVIMSEVDAAWDIDTDKDRFELKIDRLNIEKGKLVAVVGAVGSGKSTLLSVLLNELLVTEGNVLLSSRISVSPQEAWIFSDTLRENILFGGKITEKYSEVLEACALTADIESLPNRDRTLVGERGWSLSGGQKARINLARAVMTNRDIFIFDDPLSAVDTKVARHLFDQCLCGLLKEKTRILITHQLQFLEECDHIIIMKNGRVAQCGTYKEVSTSAEFDELKKDKHDKSNKGLNEGNNNMGLISSLTGFEEEPMHVYEMSKDKKLLEESNYKKSRRDMAWSVWLNYLRAGRGWLFGPLYLILSIIAVTCFIATDWWILRWASDSGTSSNSSMGVTSSPDYNVTTSNQDDDLRGLMVYMAISITLFISTILRSFCLFACAAVASTVLHNRMFKSVLKSPMHFFETTPIGNILNRFARDTGFMDQMLPRTVAQTLTFVFVVMGELVFIGVIMPWVIIFLVPIVIFIFFLRYFAMFTIREFKHVEAACRAPVYSYLSSTVHGLHVIRAHDRQQHMMGCLHQVQNVHSSAWFTYFNCHRWLALRVEWSTLVFMAGCLGTSFFIKERDEDVDGRLVGLGLTYIIMILALLQYILQTSVEAETQMTSVERILQYTDLEEEAAYVTSEDPPKDWPQRGALSMTNMTLKYRSSDVPALRDVTLEIKEAEKIGIVGRTGAGKSSLFAALLRLTEPGGIIKIDNTFTTNIGLQCLRENMSSIPQDPILLKGTLRSNLDPWNRFTDDEIWSAIEKIQLKAKISQMSSGLDTSVSEGGHNFSVGQRQLICLARAILLNNKILLIDEATANVDQRTDAIIQHTMKDTFKSCTVLTIAHRLNTIMESDRIVVFERGKIAEIGSAHELLQNEGGFLYNLVEETKSEDAKELRAAAEVAASCNSTTQNSSHSHA